MKQYVLVHGAWMGAWVWDRVASGLKAGGAEAHVVELPGHGADSTPLSEANLPAYVAAVENVVSRSPGKVILVGHSMGGMVTQVAEDLPERIERLVYLAAYLPKDGQKLLDMAMADGGSESGKVLKIDEKNGIADVPLDRLANCFLADGSSQAIEALQTHYKAEPLAGFVGPVHTTVARWGAVKKVYFYTKQDHAISYELQQKMTAGVDLVSTHMFDTSHSPFLSQPAQVVSALANL